MSGTVRRPLILALVVTAVLALVPGWSGEPRLALFGPHARMTAIRVSLDPADPARRRLGALTFLGGVALSSDDPAFGGFSAMTVEGERFTLLSDGGNVVRFRMGEDWVPRDQRFGALPAGPGTGWLKDDRDAEAMAGDGRSVWVGFEGANAIWRYDRDFRRVEGRAAPAAMADWWEGAGPESLVRRRDGSVVVLSEDPPPGHGRLRRGLVFAGDPTATAGPAWAFDLATPRRFDPADACELPDGRLVILLRGFALPYRFTSRIMLVERGAIRPGARVEGRVVATLAAPLLHDNFEGIAVTREAGATILWLVSDDNQSLLQRSLLLKFRLDR